MKKEIIDILKRPFPKDLIKHRRGSDGAQLAYVEVNHYIDRLDEAFQHDWSYELTKRETIGEQVIVEIRLTAGGLTKTGLEGVAISRHNGAAVSVADDAKMAEAGALRRACRLFGIGSELYATAPYDDGGVISGRPAVNDNGQPEHGSHTLPFGERAHAPRERLTAAQLHGIKERVKAHGLDVAAFRKKIKATFGIELEYLNKRQASEVIVGLDGKKPGNGTSGPQAWAGS